MCLTEPRVLNFHFGRNMSCGVCGQIWPLQKTATPTCFFFQSLEPSTGPSEGVSVSSEIQFMTQMVNVVCNILSTCLVSNQSARPLQTAVLETLQEHLPVNNTLSTASNTLLRTVVEKLFLADSRKEQGAR